MLFLVIVYSKYALTFLLFPFTHIRIIIPYLLDNITIGLRKNTNKLITPVFFYVADTVDSMIPNKFLAFGR